ncbi:MAG: hypothetical protein ACYDBB_17730 [Armatimonadota bacterium]
MVKLRQIPAQIKLSKEEWSLFFHLLDAIGWRPLSPYLSLTSLQYLQKGTKIEVSDVDACNMAKCLKQWLQEVGQRHLVGPDMSELDDHEVCDCITEELVHPIARKLSEIIRICELGGFDIK